MICFIKQSLVYFITMRITARLQDATG